MIRLYLLVGLGGAIGSIGRFALAVALSEASASWPGPRLPWPTVAVNITGSLAIGWLAGAGSGPAMQAFAVAGLCGGFTTFSSFSLQTIELLRAGRNLDAALNVCVSVVLCLTATFLGWTVAVRQSIG